MSTTNEHSAGLILYHLKDATPLYLLLDYGRHWDYPKGHVEPGESDLTAAFRELAEETSITTATRTGDFAHTLTYFFRSKTNLIRKTVTFFLAHSPTMNVTLSHEHQSHAFLPYDQALARVTYKSSKEVLTAADLYLKSHPLTSPSL